MSASNHVAQKFSKMQNATRLRKRLFIAGLEGSDQAAHMSETWCLQEG